MNLSSMFEAQQRLDDRIVSEKNLDVDAILPYRIFSMAKELTELAQELQGEWKFWKSNVTHDRFKILEEYVDGLHFLLGLGNFLGYHKQTIELIQGATTFYHLPDPNRNVFYQLVQVDMELADMYEQPKRNYPNLFFTYYTLGRVLDFTDEEIEAAYFAKNKVNHERQDNGY